MRHVFASREYRELDEIVLQFVSETGVHPSIASFGIAGPVLNGKVEASNLPWVVESSRLAQQLQLDSVSLINDLEAQAWGIQCLEPTDTVALNQIAPDQNHPEPAGNQAVIAAGTGLGANSANVIGSPAARIAANWASSRASVVHTKKAFATRPIATSPPRAIPVHWRVLLRRFMIGAFGNGL